MDADRFDAWTRSLFAARTRRRLLAGMGGLLAAAVLPRRVVAQGEVNPNCPGCWAYQHCMAGGTACCTGTLCPGADGSEGCCGDWNCCGSGCCRPGDVCVTAGSRNVAAVCAGACPEGRVQCGTVCCGENEECGAGDKCVARCDGVRCGEACCGDGEECDGNGQCVDPCVAAATRETSGRRGRRQRRSEATAELTCPQCGANEFPCLVNGQFATCCDGTCCYGPNNASVTCCHPDQTCCGGVCCGGNARPDEVCVEVGRCGCATGLITCQGRCVAPCTGGATLDENCRCRCPDDRPVNCNLTCVAKCPRGKTLDFVTCQCVKPCKNRLVRCNGTCVNFNRDERNCGDCGRTCRADEKCIKGSCVFDPSRV